MKYLFLLLLSFPVYGIELILVDPKDRELEERRQERMQRQEVIDYFKERERRENLELLLIPNLYERDRKKYYGQDKSSR